MGKRRDKKDHSPKRSNYKAQGLLRICYPAHEDDSVGGTIDTRRLAETLPRAAPPKMDNRPVVQPGAQWSDPDWLRTKLATMDLKLKSRSAYLRSEASGYLSPEEEEEQEEKRLTARVELTAEQKQQQRNATRLMTHYTGVADTTAASLQQRHSRVTYPPFISALGKLGRAAVLFTGESSDGGYSRALNNEVMSATRLDTFLTQFFRVKLTAEELGATVRWMDADGNGTIDGSEFLREFWKFGAVEHLRSQREAKRRERLVARQQRAAKADWMTRFSLVTPATVTPTFTANHLREAEQLLANAAADMDTGSIHSKNIRGQVFDGAPMTPADLATALRMNFRVILDAPQLAAIVGTYDDDGNGTIEGSEFYQHFTKLGIRERRRRRDAHAQELRDRQGREGRLSEACMKRYNATERVTDVVFPEEVKRRQRRARKGGVNWNEPVDRPAHDERSVPEPSRGPTRGRAPRVFLRE